MSDEDYFAAVAVEKQLKVMKEHMDRSTEIEKAFHEMIKLIEIFYQYVESKYDT